MKRVLVTGATGFIGERLVRRLLDCGYRVRVLCRSPRAAARLDGAEVAVGDVTDLPSLRAAMEGTEGVFHLAALYKFGVGEAQMRRVNVEGTRNVLTAAAGLRLLYCGSDTSLGDTAGQVRDESFQAGSPPRSHYERTKREAHALVSGTSAINAIVSTVYGPGDGSPIGELLRHFVAGRMPFILDPDAGYTLAHVDDVAEGLRLAYERGEPGQSYLVSGTPVSFADLFARLSSLSGLEPPRWVVPRWMRRLTWLWVALFGLFLRKRPAESRELLAMGSGVTRWFSGARLRGLGWKPRSLDAGLGQTLAPLLDAQQERSRRALGGTRALTTGLALFDLALGGGALLLPGTYLLLMHPRFDGGPTYLLGRTGMLWLFFAAVEIAAAWRPGALVVGLVGLLRLMDVPADLLYFAQAGDLGDFGRFALLFSPAFNLAAGLYLVTTAAGRLRLDRRGGGRRHSQDGQLVGDDPPRHSAVVAEAR